MPPKRIVKAKAKAAPKAKAAAKAKPKAASKAKAVKATKTTKVTKAIKATKSSSDETPINPKGQYVLVIVESPGKIKKLESILGKGYVVMSSYGHIMDLYPNKLSVDVDNDFEPEYTIIKGKQKFQDKTKVVKDLQAAAKKATKVVIASDEDREGEMIGWCYMTALGLQNPERITFHSITRDAIHKAINNPGRLDMRMVESQKARRILDRLVGFKISPELNQVMGMRNLSAGRVQSVVTRIICDKEEEIIKFFEGDQASYFRYNGEFEVPVTNGDLELKCELYTSNPVSLEDAEDSEKDDDESEGEAGDSDEESEDGKSGKKVKHILYDYDDAYDTMDSISNSKFKVSSVDHRQTKSYPSAPFTTSTAQQDASTKLGFSVKRTMSALQKLYEAGLTTYLRTDSTVLSKEAMAQCATYIKENYGDDMYNRKEYSSKKQNTQEAHEAIRPVSIQKRTVKVGGKIGADEVKMYDLVWKRTVASQMKHCTKEAYDIEISPSKLKTEWFKSTIMQISDPGFLTVYGFERDVDAGLIPKKGQKVDPQEVRCLEDYKKPPLRYTEAKLIKMMDPKNLNIGRPATYAETINTIQKRKYVEVRDVDGFEKECRTLTWAPGKSEEIDEEEKTVHIGKERNKFCPTELGIEVNSLMMRNFPDLMDYKFTSRMEDQLDEIAEGTSDWVEVLQEFWDKLTPLLEKMGKEKKKERVLGTHPEYGTDVVAAMGYYGPMLSYDRVGEGKKKDMVTAPLKKPYKIESVTLKTALEILKYPKLLGDHPKTGKPVELKTGKFGPYVVHGKESANLAEDADPDLLTLEEALQLIEEKKKARKAVLDKYLYYHKEGNIEYIINNGKFGRYLMVKDVTKKRAKPFFCNVTDDEDLEDMTFERAKQIESVGRANKGKKKTGSGSKSTSKAKAKGATKAKAKAAPKAKAKAAPKAKAKGKGKSASPTKIIRKRIV
jgi:DNA topoisomerase-1